MAEPGLEEQRPGIAQTIWGSPYLTLFPAGLDDPEAEWPADVHRFRDPLEPASDKPLPDWWTTPSRSYTSASALSSAARRWRAISTAARWRPPRSCRRGCC